MKKSCIVVLSIFILSLTGYGQNVSYNKSTYDLTGDVETMVTPELKIKNISSGSIEIFVNRFYQDLPANWTSCFCFLVCNPPSVDTLRFTMVAGEEVTIGVGFNTDTIPGVGYVKLTVQEVGSTTQDTLSFSGSTLASGITELNKLSPSFSAFPNPTAGEIIFNSSLNEPYTVTVLDNTGKTLKSLSDLSQKKHALNIENYPAGKYFLKAQYRSGKTETLTIIKN